MRKELQIQIPPFDGYVNQGICPTFLVFFLCQAEPFLLQGHSEDEVGALCTTAGYYVAWQNTGLRC